MCCNVKGNLDKAVSMQLLKLYHTLNNPKCGERGDESSIIRWIRVMLSRRTVTAELNGFHIRVMVALGCPQGFFCHLSCGGRSVKRA